MSNFSVVKLLDDFNIVNIPSGLVPKGAYAAGTDYAVGDSVDYNGSSYVMFVDATAGTLPTDITKWQVLANKGDQGVPGVVGGTLEDLGGATKALDNLASVAINTSLISDTDSTDDLGSSAKYWANGYVDKLYVNSTAYLDGATAGVLKVSLGTDSLSSTDNGFIYHGSTGHVILQTYGFALGEIMGAWNGKATGLMGAKGNTVGMGGGTGTFNGIYSEFYTYNVNSDTSVLNSVFAYANGYAVPNGGSFGWVNAVAGQTDGNSGSTGVIVNSVAFHAMFGTKTLVTNTYGFYMDALTAIGTNRYGIYLNNVSGGTLNYAIYTGTGLVRLGDSLVMDGTTPTIQTTANKNLSLIPNGTGYTIIGDAGTTSHSFNTNDDLLVSGRLEVNGTTYFDGGVYVEGADNFILGSTTGFSMRETGTQTDALLGFVGDTDGYWLLTKFGFRTKDFDHAAQTNPTLFIHSAVDPDTNNTQWLSLTHDQTNGVIAVGTGGVGFSNIILPVQAATASAPTYVKGAIYFDTTLNKLRVGGATAWETITSA